jgi:predicted ribosome quality control (RQC) complex YloA/Tae2 family protein
MAWVSMIEDICERFEADIESISRQLDEEQTQRDLSASREKLNALIRVSQSFVRDLQQHMELATSPDIDLAATNQQLQLENGRLQIRVTQLEDLQQNVQGLEKMRDEAITKAAKREAALGEAQRRIDQLEKELKRTRRGH